VKKSTRNGTDSAARDAIAALVELRKKRGKTQRELAELLGVSQPVVAGIERAKNLEFRTLVRIADALDADVRITLVERRTKGTKRAA
jgi:transcriptional regulator with XRE-family HTH domain